MASRIFRMHDYCIVFLVNSFFDARCRDELSPKPACRAARAADGRDCDARSRSEQFGSKPAWQTCRPRPCKGARCNCARTSIQIVWRAAK